jgi:hypothetical protein
MPIPEKRPKLFALGLFFRDLLELLLDACVQNPSMKIRLGVWAV